MHSRITEEHFNPNRDVFFPKLNKNATVQRRSGLYVAVTLLHCFRAENVPIQVFRYEDVLDRSMQSALFLLYIIKIIQAASQSCVESVIAAHSIKEKDHGHVSG